MLLRRYHSNYNPTTDEQAPDAFDPAAHTVEEVLDYLGISEGHDPVTADELERVREAEQAGKARKTLLAAIDDRPDESGEASES